MTGIVDGMLESMTEHNPDKLPVATVYYATENSHPASLGMMTAWRTITKAGKPDFVAIDTVAGQAYLETQVSEAGDLTALWGRIKVENRKITEVELFLSRSRGDHGFSFSADKLPENFKVWEHPPANRVKASRAELEKLSRASFTASDPYTIPIADNCQFLEVGSHVIDPGLDDAASAPPAGMAPMPARDPNSPLGCIFPPGRPSDPQYRPLVIDEELGVVVTAAIVPGYVYPYPFFGRMLSAFIPTQMKPPLDAQQQWFERKVAQNKGPLVHPSLATGEVMQVFQVYDGKLQGSQINVYLSGPGAHSSWVPTR